MLVEADPRWRLYVEENQRFAHWNFNLATDAVRGHI